MVRIPDLPDLSRFVQRADKVPVYNTIHLLVGEESVEVSGPVICQASQVLEGLVGNQPELYLDQFTGEIEGIYDVVEILYGGEVKLSEQNFKTVLKFSVLFDVTKLYRLCIEWLKEHIATLDLFSLIQFGVFIQTLAEDGKRDIIDLCTSFVKDHVKDGLMELSKSWVITDNSLIKFLVQESIFYYTLPVIISWVRNDTDVNAILQELEAKSLVASLWSFGVRSSDLLDKMNDSCDSVDTFKRISAMQGRNYRACVTTVVENSHFVSKLPKKDLVGLLSLGYCSFKLGDLLAIEKDFNLTHPQFIEIAVAWIKSKPGISQQDLKTVWDSFRESEVHQSYVSGHVLNSLRPLELEPKKRLPSEDQYKLCLSSFIATADSIIKGSVNFDQRCDRCNTRYNFIVRFVDKTPCFEVDAPHCDIQHVYLVYEDKGYFTCYSLITNSYREVQQIIKECKSLNRNLFLCFLHSRENK